MLSQTKDLQNLTIGNVNDLYFDGASWTIRCLVVETGSRGASHPVLISPFAADVLVTRPHEADYSFDWENLC
jgi:hypothetical protein